MLSNVVCGRLWYVDVCFCNDSLGRLLMVPGAVQELIAALLACSFLCLFPVGARADEMLPDINCDRLFGYAASHRSAIRLDRTFISTLTPCKIAAIRVRKLALLACLLLACTGGAVAHCLPLVGPCRLLVRGAPSQAAKVQCLVHYFARVTQQPPRGTVTFERKVLPLPGGPGDCPAPLPTSADWAASTAPLCPLQVSHTTATAAGGMPA